MGGKHTMKRWGKPFGYRQVLSISLPLVASMSSQTVMQFVDRLFLADYSLEAIAASVPGGMVSFMFMSVFLGVAFYVGTFVAQYTGARAPERVGASLWQGIYFCLFSGLVLIAISFAADPIFAWAGHPPEVRPLESIYFRILTIGAVFALLSGAMSTFYSGRGLTRVVMIVSILGAVVNIPLDYALINGKWGMPEWGIAGAAVATVFATMVQTAIYVFLIFRKENDRIYGVLRARAFDRELFGRLCRYGVPSGIQFLLQVASFTFFFMIIGRLGKVELAASNMVFSLDHLAFLPMVGFHTGATILVGQAVGGGHPPYAKEATVSTLHLTLAYVTIVSLLFILCPGWLLDMFQPRNITAADFAPIREAGVLLMRFVAFYVILDGVGLVFSATLKGAGDTNFVMKMVAVLSLTIMVIPTYLAIEYLDNGLLWAWLMATLFICIVAGAFYLRYRNGRWQTMSVIEKPAPPL